MTENTANRVKVQHFSRIKNYEKIASCMPPIMGGLEIPGPPLPPLKKTTLRENDRNYRKSRKSTALFPYYNYEKRALCMP